jgi:hypothetical protein
VLEARAHDREVARVVVVGVEGGLLGFDAHRLPRGRDDRVDLGLAVDQLAAFHPVEMAV